MEIIPLTTITYSFMHLFNKNIQSSDRKSVGDPQPLVWDWLKRQIRQVMIWLLQMQHTLGMLHFREQLFTVVFSTKHAYYLLGLHDKNRESSKWKYEVLVETEDVACKKVGLQIFWSLKIKKFHLQMKWYFFIINIKKWKLAFEGHLWPAGSAVGISDLNKELNSCYKNPFEYNESIFKYIGLHSVVKTYHKKKWRWQVYKMVSNMYLTNPFVMSRMWQKVNF